MGAPSAQVQQGQTSGFAGKGAGMSPSTDRTTMTMGGLSGQPGMGAPNPQAAKLAMNALGGDVARPTQNAIFGKGDDFARPVNKNFIAPIDGATNQNPFPNTIGSNVGRPDGQPMNQTMGKGFGGGAGGGKGAASAANPNRAVNDPMGMIENTSVRSGYRGPGTNN